MKTSLYYLAIAALFTHELDAVLNMEWRLLFYLRTLPDPEASSIFVALHFPLFFAFFYFGHHKNGRVRETFRFVIASFLVVHGMLHFRLSDHELYQFSGFLSNFYIYSASLCGLAFIVLSWKQRRSNGS
ncbi:DUF6713 family protein [Kangiella sp. TOML190]|uniref:DUF6713 family protein n=1 Tax=Kangiella sp. TOML190 TaxID=2931351 RepID=UPI00203EE262|nr:DUF6713 family protein [Kangiella sp. TOML190]